MFSILHITDLHRAKSDPISNAELLSALISDSEGYSYEDPPIPRPKAIVVSGDVIQGVTLHHSNYEAELAEQYDAAYEFLTQLTDRFLGGDRTKVIIVPGNHDIDWNVALSAMDLVEDEKLPTNLPGALYEANSPYRWDWKSRRLYIVRDKPRYDLRLAAFWSFFQRFYDGCEGMLRVVAGADANLYSLDEGRIGVAAFNSCVSNDCFSFRGEISREVIAQSYLDLKDLGPWRLQIAVWHHDIDGPPHRSDYMDLEIVRGMIGRGFRLGLYGHQHRVQITPQHAHLLNEETMVVVSAGSLCAGARELPTGALRGYSIIEIHDDYRGARVHVREMRFSNLFSKAILRDFQGRSFVDLTWTTPLDAAGRPENPVAEERVAILRAAEDALHGSNNPKETLRILSKIDISDDPFARRLILDAATAIGNPNILIDKVGVPQTIGELILLVDAHIEVGESRKASEVLANDSDRLSVPRNIRNDLQTKIKLIKWRTP